MELETFALIAEVVAGVVVVISLVALASEIRQNNRALARQASLQSFGQFSHARRSLYTDAHARELLDKAQETPDQLTFGDRFAHENLVLEAAFVCSYFHRDIAKGMIPAEVWTSAKEHFDPEFTAAIDRATGDHLTG